MQFDADEDEEPFFKPQVMQTEPIPTSQPRSQQQPPRTPPPTSTDSGTAPTSATEQQQVPSSPETPRGNGNLASSSEIDPHGKAAAVAAAMSAEQEED
jgi:hypothetical protein